MVDGIDIFNSIGYLEPKCKHCNAKLEYGVNTKWEEAKSREICMECGGVIRVEKKTIF